MEACGLILLALLCVLTFDGFWVSLTWRRRTAWSLVFSVWWKWFILYESNINNLSLQSSGSSSVGARSFGYGSVRQLYGCSPRPCSSTFRVTLLTPAGSILLPARSMLDFLRWRFCFCMRVAIYEHMYTCTCGRIHESMFSPIVCVPHMYTYVCHAHNVYNVP